MRAMPGDPAPPPGYTLAAGHCIGDSTTTSKNCLNPPQQLKASNACTSADDCFQKASADCLANDACSGFAYANKMYETFSVGLANVVANADWTAYAKPMLCCQCPDSGAFVKSTAKKVQSFTTGLHHWHTDHQCATNGNRGAGSPPGPAILFCAAFDPKSPGCPVGIEAENNAGSLLFAGLLLLGFVYITGGVALGRKTGRSQQPGLRGVWRLASPHPHYRRWAELHSLVVDGVHFSRSRAGLGGARQYSPVPSPGTAGESGRSKESSERRSSVRRNTGSRAGPIGATEGANEAAKRSSNSGKRRSRGGGSSDALERSAAGPRVPISAQSQQPEHSAELTERRELQEGLHESQAKITVVGINL